MRFAASAHGVRCLEYPMAPDAGSLFDSIPETISEELFTQILHGKDFRMERIVSKGHTSPESGWYDQDENEWVFVLQGEAKLLFSDQGVEHLSAGSYINIPARTKHKVIWTPSDRETIWLAIHYK